MPRTCIFCGASDLTTEHVLGRWLEAQLPGKRGGFAMVRVNLKTETGEGFRTRAMPVQTNRVCAKCNNGWLSNIEAAASRQAGPLIRGLKRRLRPERQTTIATWATKTAILLRYALSPPRPTPRDQREWLFKHAEPPPNSFVFLARYGGDPTGVDWRHQRAGGHIEDEPVEAEIVTMRIGHLVWQVAQFFTDDEIELARPGDSRVIIPIWPATGQVLAWPPPVPMNRKFYDEFSTTLQRQVKGKTQP